MDNELSIVRLVLQASPIVQGVMGLLLLASLFSWAIIFRKRALLSRAHDEAENFEDSFWKGGDLTALYRQIESRGGATGMSSIFEFGFREFARLKQGGIPPEQLLEGARRAMRVGQLKELERLEESLASLATIGSTSPYVGLFGTVWGILNSFVALGGVQQATVNMKSRAAAIKPGKGHRAFHKAFVGYSADNVGIVAGAQLALKANPTKGVAVVKRTAKQGKALDKKFVAKHGAHGLSCF